MVALQNDFNIIELAVYFLKPLFLLVGQYLNLNALIVDAIAHIGVESDSSTYNTANHKQGLEELPKLKLG